MTEEKYLHDLSNVLAVLSGSAKRLEKQVALDLSEIDLETLIATIDKVSMSTTQIIDLTSQRKNSITI